MKFNKAEVTARSSLTKKIYNGVTPDVIAFMWVNGEYSAIFNQSVPYERFYTNGQEVDTRHIERGSVVDGDIHIGREYTYDDILHAYGYYGSWGVSVTICGRCGTCDNDGVNRCSIITKHQAKANSASGDVSYYWEVAGASLVSGQGTSAIVVQTIGVYSVEVSLRCTVHDDHSSAYDEDMCLHKRTHNMIGDTVLVPHVALKPAPDLVPYTGEIR